MSLHSSAPKSYMFVRKTIERAALLISASEAGSRPYLNTFMNVIAHVRLDGVRTARVRLVTMPLKGRLPDIHRLPILAIMSESAQLQAEFEKFDTDKNGYIDESEFAQLLKSLGVHLSPEKSAVAFLAIDVNGNGRIEFGEFGSWWKKHHAG